jgi:hypothetical protein
MSLRNRSYSKVLALLLSLSIASAPVSGALADNSNWANNLAFKLALPILEKLFFAEVAIAPSSRSVFPTSNLQGGEFDAEGSRNKKIRLNPNGSLYLQPGDYEIPVQTYCMESSASSPNAHRYTLSKLEGKRAAYIRSLNLKGPALASTSALQPAELETSKRHEVG